MSSGKTTVFSTDFLDYIFQATEFPFDAITTLYVSLHTAGLLANSNQGTSEATYTGYARVAVSRNSGGWSVSGNQAQNAGSIVFGANSGASQTITTCGIGTASSGAGTLLYFGDLSASVAVGTGVTPEFALNTLAIAET
jgi:hypothetical protein